ncbi:MAG TPA: hypothetical protein VFQ39_02670 [Longimicrobium sp.]|nr:hypothetical protein [Longimicrobium sp.]
MPGLGTLALAAGMAMSLAGCAARPAASPAPLSDDGVVWTAVVKSELAASRAIVLYGETIDASWLRRPPHSLAFERLPSGMEHAFFAANDPGPVPIRGAFARSDRVTLISPAEHERRMGKGDEAWSRFHAAWPGASHLVYVSRPGYDKKRTRAVVYASSHCGLRCGEGRFYLLAREEGRWRVERVENVWVS